MGDALIDGISMKKTIHFGAYPIYEKYITIFVDFDLLYIPSNHFLSCSKSPKIFHDN